MGVGVSRNRLIKCWVTRVAKLLFLSAITQVHAEPEQIRVPLKGIPQDLRTPPGNVKIPERKVDLQKFTYAVKPQCPDLKAEKIFFKLKSRQSRNEGRVQITGTIRNFGHQSYRSSPRLQEIFLQDLSDPSRPKMLVRQAFQNLEPGEAITVSYERNWYAASPAEGEFPPTYRLTINYNPDIKLDGDVNNDDCNWRNNSIEKNSAEINSMFH